MSILIKGMEMPKACVACPCACEVDGSCHITGYKPSFAEWYEDGVKECPLVPVPKHGRLIDKDALLEDIDRNMIVTPSKDGSLVEVHGAEKILAHIAYAPTVIEKDGE